LHKDEFDTKTRHISNSKLKLNDLERKYSKYKKEIKTLIRKSAENDDLKDDYLEGIRDLKEELKEVEIEIENYKNEILLNDAIEDNKDIVIKGLSNIKKAVHNAKSMEIKRILIRNVVSKIHVDGTNKTFEIELCL